MPCAWEVFHNYLLSKSRLVGLRNHGWEENQFKEKKLNIGMAKRRTAIAMDQEQCDASPVMSTVRHLGVGLLFHSKRLASYSHSETLQCSLMRLS